MIPRSPLRATALWATFYLYCILGAPATRLNIVRQRGPLGENTAPTRRGARAGPVHADHNEHGAEARGHTPRGRARGTPGGCSDGDTVPGGTATWRAVSARAEGDGAESAQLQPGGGGTHALRRARWVPARPGATGDGGSAQRAGRRGDPSAAASVRGPARPGTRGTGSAQRAGGALVRDASRPTMTTALYRVKATERGTQRSSRAGDVESVGRTTP